MIRHAAILMFAIAVASCGSSTPGNTDGKPQDGTGSNVHHDAAVDVGIYDFGCGGNTACPLDKVCCSMPGSPTQFNCVAPASCPAVDKIACDGPDECGGTTPVCCGIDTPNGTGTYPQCTPSALGTSCTSATACPTHLGQTCSDTTKVQICHVNAECTDSTNNKCCTFTSGAAQLTFCIDSLTASLGGGTCHP